VSAAGEPEVITIARYPLTVSIRSIPVVNVALGQISTFSIVSDVIIRCVDRSPVRISFSVVVEELVLVGAITAGSIGGSTYHTPPSSLVGTDVGGQHEGTGRENSFIRVVESCLPRVELWVECCVVHEQRVGELIDGLREPVVG